MSHVLAASSPSSMRKNCQAIIGSPEEVLEKILFLTDLLKVDQIMWQIDFGSQPFEVSYESLKLFAEKVMPFVNQAHEPIRNVRRTSCERF